MNNNYWSRYKFSKESEPELQEFFKAVAEHNPSASNFNNNKLWEKLLPVDEAFQQCINCFKTATTNEVIEIADSDDEDIGSKDNTEKQLHNEDEFLLPHQSFTQLTLNESRLNTTTTEDLIDGVQELLQTESFLSEDVIKQFGSEISSQRLQEMFTLFASNLNSQCTLKLWNSITVANCIERNAVASCFSQYILIPKILSEDDDGVKVLFTEVFNKFPDELLTLLKNILFQTNNSDLTVLTGNISTLSYQHKNSLLRVFEDHCPKLELSHVVTLLNLITPHTDIENLNKLIELMSTVAKDFASEKVFGKLLLEILQVLGSNVFISEQQLRYIISTHKSIFKTQIQKLFESSLQDQKLFSQSLKF